MAAFAGSVKLEMSPDWNRRDVLKGLAAASTAAVLSPRPGTAWAATQDAGQQVEIQISPVSAQTFRLSIFPLNHGSVGSMPLDGSLLRESCGAPIATLRADPGHT